VVALPIPTSCCNQNPPLTLSYLFAGKDGELSGTMQDKSYDGINGPQIRADAMNAQYTVETVVMAVLAAAIFALLVGFITGYFCGRRCHKDEDDNLPYPDTEYEYFEQRSNINR
jgi:semaphorin 6